MSNTNLPWDKKPKYIILQGVLAGNKFFSSNSRTHGDPRYLSTGKLAYNIIGYAETIKEAQIKLYGRSFTKSTD